MTVRIVIPTPLERAHGRLLRGPFDHPSDDNNDLDEEDDQDDNDEQSDQTDDQEDDLDQEDDTDDSEASDDEDSPKRGTSGYEKRIGKLTARNKALEQRLAALEAGKRGSSTEDKKPTNSNVKPILKDFDTYEDWVEALTDWKADQRIAASQKQREIEETNKSFGQRYSKGQKQFRDWDDVVTDDMQIANSAIESLKDSDYPAEIVYYLANNPDELDALNAMRPAKQAIALGKIEAKIERAAKNNKSRNEPRETTSAPKPINPTKGGGKATTKSYEKMSMTEYMAARNREERAKRGYR